MLIRDILSRKGTKVITVPPETGLREVVDTMLTNKVGAVIIADGSKVLGMFTERDNLRLTADRGVDLNTATVGPHMTSDIVIGLPGDTVESTMATMTEKRIRHLPIMSDGLLVGIVSIGDVVKALADQQEHEIHFLKNYIAGEMT
ncbi:CBS domain-containing protein [bacterium]|nr:CBS domain-containing protein [bacterium]